MRHTFSVWRTPVEQGFSLWARCHCGHEIYARNYEDLAVLTSEHVDDIHDLAILEAEERAHS